MKISGSGTITGGEYAEDIIVSGAANAQGNISCQTLQVSGSMTSNGAVSAKCGTKVSGNMSCDGELETTEIKSSGSLHVKGSVTGTELLSSGAFKSDGDVNIEGKFVSDGATKIEGSLRAASIEASGAFKVGGDIEAESFEASTALKCGGLINADKIDINILGDGHVTAIGGSDIKIENKNPVTSFITMIFGKTSIGGMLTVEDAIEGDVINVSHVKANRVTGRIVNIGEDCEIELVQFTESADVNNSAKVGRVEEI